MLSQTGRRNRMEIGLGGGAGVIIARGEHHKKGEKRWPNEIGEIL